MKPQVGQLISAPFLPGVAEVKAFSPRAGYWKLEAVLRETLQAEGNRLVPGYVEDYFLRAYRRLDGDVERRRDRGDREDGALDDVRYVEVKARAQSGAIRLSANEWKKARRYGEQFWLYVVTEAGTDPPAVAAHLELGGAVCHG